MDDTGERRAAEAGRNPAGRMKSLIAGGSVRVLEREPSEGCNIRLLDQQPFAGSAREPAADPSLRSG